jgi:hypothetical protein
LDEQERFAQARAWHERAILAAGNRENKYGVFYGVAMHWARRGMVSSRSREPGKALYSFQQANDFLQESYARNYRRRELGKSFRTWLGARIELLEGARIDAETVPGLRLEEVLDEMAGSR